MTFRDHGTTTFLSVTIVLGGYWLTAFFIDSFYLEEMLIIWCHIIYKAWRLLIGCLDTIRVRLFSLIVRTSDTRLALWERENNSGIFNDGLATS